MDNQTINIVSVDAKDLWLSKNSPLYPNQGYDIRNADGSLRTQKFSSALDHSLESEKLMEFHDQVYPDRPFSTQIETKLFTQSVVNVTFHFSVKKFNRFWGGVFIRHDVSPERIELQDGVCIQDGKLAAIQTDSPVSSPINPRLLDSCFTYHAPTSTYQPASFLPTVLTVAELRRALYTEGFWCDGIRYVRYKRSAGSSRVGKCLFIDEKLYPLIHEWELCGLSLPEGETVDLAALESYLSLPLSNIIGSIQIKPENILVMDDSFSVFEDKVAAVTLEHGKLCAGEQTTSIQNNIFDGQSLIDPSLMGAYRRQGFILLRNRMFKSACFNCNIQAWFRDHGILDVSQLHGYTRAKQIQDVKLITTPSSIKYLKFGSLDGWLDHSDPTFGVVKHDKPTPFFGGQLVQLHYQLLNTLQLGQAEVDQLLSPSLEYLKLMKTEPAVFRHHVGMRRTPVFEEGPTFSKNDVVFRLMGMNEDFVRTKLYQDFRTESLKAYTRNLRCGHVLVNGNYSTLCGNPIEMLQCACGLFDGTSQIGVGNIFSSRFPKGRDILGSRSPHITMGNIWIARNTENPEIQRYMNLTDTIVCVNSIGENLLSRLSGCDFDSDSVLLTDNPILLEAARKNYGYFPVPTSCVPAKKITRRYTPEEKAELDIRTSVNRIGEIVNLSQELNSLFWDRANSGVPLDELNGLYYDISILDVLSNIEIDKAKREYSIDSGAEIERIKRNYQRCDSQGRAVKPNFFSFLAKSKGFYDTQRKKYAFHKTTMDYLQHTLNRYRSPILKEPVLPFSAILKRQEQQHRKTNYRQVNRILEDVRAAKREIQAIWNSDSIEMDREKKYAVTQELQERLIQKIAGTVMNPSTMHRLLAAMEEEKNRDIAKTLFTMLFGTANASFYQLIQSSKAPVSTLEPACDKEILLYGLRYRRTSTDR